VDQQALRTTFDRDAVLYHEARAGYPEELFDDIVSFATIPNDGRILEIGCGTGLATLPFARRGYETLAVELGENLASLARHNLASYPNVWVLTGAFEEWEARRSAFDLAFSATAFHWIKQPVGYQKCALALRRGGTLAIFRHHHVQNDDGTDFWDEVQEIYDREMYQRPTGTRLLTAGEIPDQSAEITETGLFGPVEIRRYRWDEHYNASSYIRLLSTYSDHIALDDYRRQRLFDGISSLIDGRYGGRIAKGYLVILHLTQRL
jgi:SAM-dependent methyltransferase